MLSHSACSGHLLILWNDQRYTHSHSFLYGPVEECSGNRRRLAVQQAMRTRIRIRVIMLSQSALESEAQAPSIFLFFFAKMIVLLFFWFSNWWMDAWGHEWPFITMCGDVSYQARQREDEKENFFWSWANGFFTSIQSNHTKKKT